MTGIWEQLVVMLGVAMLLLFGYPVYESMDFFLCTSDLTSHLWSSDWISQN